MKEDIKAIQLTPNIPGSVEAEPLMNHVDGDHDDKRYIEDYLWNGQKPGVQR